MALRVVGRPGSRIDDRILLRIGDEFASPITLSGEGEQFAFSDFAYIRIGRDRVVVRGGLQRIELPVGRARPELIVNGRPEAVEVADGVLTWRK